MPVTLTKTVFKTDPQDQIPDSESNENILGIIFSKELKITSENCWF